MTDLTKMVEGMYIYGNYNQWIDNCSVAGEHERLLREILTVVAKDIDFTVNCITDLRKEIEANAKNLVGEIDRIENRIENIEIEMHKAERSK